MLGFHNLSQRIILLVLKYLLDKISFHISYYNDFFSFHFPMYLGLIRSLVSHK